jgi:hypothetical protein
MIWASIDIGDRMGVAVWDGDIIDSVAEIIKSRKRWVARVHGAKNRYETLYDALLSATMFASLVIVEEGFGGFPAVISSQAEKRGHVCALCDSKRKQYRKVNVKEWRRAIKDHCGVTWPAKGDDCKRLAIATVKRLYGIDVSEHVADAILLGVASMRLGYVGGMGVYLQDKTEGGEK